MYLFHKSINIDKTIQELDQLKEFIRNALYADDVNGIPKITNEDTRKELFKRIEHAEERLNDIRDSMVATAKLMRVALQAKDEIKGDVAIIDKIDQGIEKRATETTMLHGKTNWDKEVQEKLREELEEVIGDLRLIKEKEKDIEHYIKQIT